MGVEKRGEHWYGGEQADIRAELDRYSTSGGYPVQHFSRLRFAPAAFAFFV